MLPPFLIRVALSIFARSAGTRFRGCSGSGALHHGVAASARDVVITLGIRSTASGGIVKAMTAAASDRYGGECYAVVAEGAGAASRRSSRPLMALAQRRLTARGEDMASAVAEDGGDRTN